MIPKKIAVADGEVSDWIPLNRRSRDPVGITVNPHASAAGTYTVNYTQSDVNNKGEIATFSRSGTTLSVKQVNHGLSTTDQVILSNGDYSGIFDVASVIDDDNFTVTLAAAEGATNKGFAQPVIVSTLTDFDGVTGQVDSSIGFSVIAVRLDCSVSTGGPHDLLIDQY